MTEAKRSMNINIIVINGLARGGTNLVANLMASQKKWHVSDAAIAEMTCIDQFLPKDFVNHYPKFVDFKDVRGIIDVSLEKFKARCVEGVIRNISPNYHTIKAKYHSDICSYYGVPIDVWGDYINRIADIENFEDIDSIYQSIGNVIGCNFLAHRTTALTSYARYFLSRSSKHFWIEVVRNPFDRAVSSRKGHAQCLTQSFMQSKWQRDHLGKISDDRLIIINYEDVCIDPLGVVRSIFEKMGYNCRDISVNPITPDMHGFSGNSSNNTNIFDQVAVNAGVYVSSINSGDVLNRWERMLGAYILRGGRAHFFYYTTLAISDMVFLLGGVIQKFSLLVLSLNYLSILHEHGWRRVLQRCLRRFQ